MSWRDRVSPKRAWIEALVGVSMIYAMGLGMLILTFNYLFFPLTESDFVRFKGTLRSKPHFTSGKNATMELRLKEVPYFVFSANEVNRSIFKAQDELSKLRVNDTVYLVIEKEQQTIKIEHKPANFWQRSFFWKDIPVYRVDLDDDNPADFSGIIRELDQDHQYAPILACLCLVGGTILLRYEFKIYRKKRTSL